MLLISYIKNLSITDQNVQVMIHNHEVAGSIPALATKKIPKEESRK